MKILRDMLDGMHKHFDKGGRLEFFYPLYEAFDTFAFSPGDVTKGTTHVRDGIDLKRTMIMVIVALIPCMLFGIYNSGLQANMALGEVPNYGWRVDVLKFLGFGVDASNPIHNFIHGALYFFPIFIVTNAVGLGWEILFCMIRKHEVNEGMLVTGALFPLIVPASIPLWQVALAISFGIIFGKEVFGGTGKNFLNPALVARAFLFFAYPAEISGDAVWSGIDGFTGATALGQVSIGGMQAVTVSWWDAFIGFIPGSIGETSTLACLLGAVILLVTGIASWRIMLSVVVATFALSSIFYLFPGENPMFELTPMWHFVLGGFAFGTVFMATDPVSGSMTFKGQYFYGALIGVMVVLVRVVNPAFPEGMMLAILFANVFAPLIDYYVMQANIKRRRLRNV